MTVFPKHQYTLIPQYKEVTVAGKLQHHLKNIILSILKYPSIYIVSLTDLLPEISTEKNQSSERLYHRHWSDTDFSYPRRVMDIQKLLSRVISKF